MGDILKAMLEAILGGSFAQGADALATSVENYNVDAFSFAQAVNSTAIKPVAASIVAIIMTLELARIGTRYEGDSKMGTQQVAAVMIKGVLMVTAIMNVDLVLSAINEAGQLIIRGITGLTPQTSAGFTLPQEIATAVEEMDSISGVGLMFVLFLPWLLSIGGGIALKIVVFVRFFEVYALSAAATLPLAFVGNTETKSITVGYLRRYGAAILHGVMIWIIIGIYSKFLPDAIDASKITADNILGYMTSNLGTLLFQPVVFLILIFGSSKLAKAVLGEG